MTTPRPNPAPMSLRAYAGAASAAAPCLRLMLRWRAQRGREITARLPERRGLASAPRPNGKLLWLHAASVGEALSVLPLIAALPRDLAVLFTTGTVTSAALVAERIAEQGTSRRILHQFIPLDVPAWVERFLDHWRPDAAVFVESELWPNFLRAAAARNIPLALINARLSARSAARWAKLGGTLAELLGHFTFIAAGSQEDAARLTALGGVEVESPGNLKRAAGKLPAEPEALARLREAIGARPTLLAASTHASDDALCETLVAELQRDFPDLLLAIAPRHPSRGEALSARFHGTPRRALGEVPNQNPVWIADTMGEMGLLYRAFPLVIMGKSLAGGGQNPLEPARLGCALICGPAMENFADDAARLAQADAMLVCENAAAIVAAARGLLRDPERRASMGVRAAGVADADAALPAILAGRIAELLR